jgi:hypothetical protein
MSINCVLVIVVGDVFPDVMCFSASVLVVNRGECDFPLVGMYMSCGEGGDVWFCQGGE